MGENMSARVEKTYNIDLSGWLEAEEAPAVPGVPTKIYRPPVPKPKPSIPTTTTHRKTTIKSTATHKEVEEETEEEAIWWSDAVPIPDILTALAPLFYLYRIDRVSLTLKPRKEAPIT